MSALGVRPELSLAFSMASGPGTYALLLGSGVSRAAGIPTGWEVTLDLTSKLAAAQGETTGDPEEWYRERFGREPNYSELVNDLAPTRHQRRELLQGYFEPTEEEREEGLKVPTQAHRAIARLCAQGYVNVVLTTNFDRLLEHALEAEGVSPTLIRTADDAGGVPPLQHAACTVVKINGDYLDTRIKNTPDELEKYDERISGLLGRVFDEYGLVISGWSGIYDTALIDAFKRAKSRRYMTYWVSRGEPSREEQELTTFVGGTSIVSAGADEFFGDLLEKVEALAAYGGDDPLSAPVAAATTKRYLDTPERYARLRELVISISRRTGESLFGEQRFDIRWSPDAADEKERGRKYAEELQRRVFGYERRCETALAVMAAGGFYAHPQQTPAFRELLELAASPPPVDGSRLDIWAKLERYPALLLLYAGGVAAVAAENWHMLKALLRDASVHDEREEISLLIAKVHPWAIRSADTRHAAVVQRALHEGKLYHEPEAEWLYKTLREPLREYTPLDFAYEEAFHTFEALMALVYVDIRKRSERERKRRWAPLGRFAARYGEFSDRPSTFGRLRADYEAQRRAWRPIVNGLLKDPEPPDSGTPDINTVKYDFAVVEEMVSKRGYD